MIDLDRGKVGRVAFAPVLADERSRPMFLQFGDPMFAEIAREVEAATRAAGYATAFELTADGVTVG